MGKKKFLCWMTALFFGGMLFGTLFHQKIDGLFREQVTAVHPQSYTEVLTQTWEIDGTLKEVMTEEEFLLLPKEAVQDSMVYILDTVEVPYGSYTVVRLREVETAGELDDAVKIKHGLKKSDRVVTVFLSTLRDGERVAAEEE